jgi:hypothetical protein
MEAIVCAAGCCSALLYYTANGAPGSGREGDGDEHNMRSLVDSGLECLPRLIDGVLSGHPEFSFHQSWRGFLSEERRVAEDLLGHMPNQARPSAAIPRRRIGSSPPYDNTSVAALHLIQCAARLSDAPCLLKVECGLFGILACTQLATRWATDGTKEKLLAVAKGTPEYSAVRIQKQR